MQWSDFGPYVLPYVIGCPDPLMEQHARIKVIEFCRRTLCLNRAIDPEVIACSELDVPVDAGMQIIKVKSVLVDGQPISLVPEIQGRELAACGSGAAFAFMASDAGPLIFNPSQTGALVHVVAAQAPTISAATCPNEMLPYMQDIAHGVVASLMLVPGQTFSNPQQSAMHQAAFQSRMAVIAAKVSRGHLAGKMRARATYL